MFVVAPLLMYLFNKLFRGSRGARALIVVAILSIGCAYVTAVACQAALYVALLQVPFYHIAPLTLSALGKSGVLPSSISAYTYPLVFTALGVCIAWELLRVKRKAAEAETGEPSEDPAEQDEVDKDEDEDEAIEVDEDAIEIDDSEDEGEDEGEDEDDSSDDTDDTDDAEDAED